MTDPDFHDRLASLCGPEIAAAMRDDDSDRAAAMITALVSMAGRTIARATNGNPARINIMLTGAEELMASEAAAMAGVVKFAKAKGWKP